MTDQCKLKKKKILLLNPGSKNVAMRGLLRERPTEIGYCWPSTDLIISSGLLNEQGYELDYLDASLDKLTVDDVSSKIKSDNIEVVVSLFSRYLKENDIEFLKKIKNNVPGILIAILPDLQFVLDPESAVEFLKENSWLDVILLDFTSNDLSEYIDGDPSCNLKNLCYRIDDNVILGPKDIIDQNDYSLPIPRHDIFKHKKYFLPQSRRLYITTTVMQFGCSYQCDYCIDKEVYKKSWCRGPENVADEFDFISSQGFNEVYLRDLTFGLNRKRAMKFCRLLIERKSKLKWVCTSRVDVLDEELLVLMKKAGCMCIEFGVESGVDSTKELHDKGIKNSQIEKTFSICKKLGIETAAFMMLGFPEETFEDMNDSLRFCKSLNPDFIVLNLANALPETKFGNKILGNENKDDAWKDVSYFDGNNFSHPNVSSDELCSLYKNTLLKFYLNPLFVLKRLCKLRSFGAFIRVFKMGMGVLRSIFSN